MYQTLKEVKQAASGSNTDAIKSSIRHWKELSKAPPSDLIEASTKLDGGLYPGWRQCALCMKYFPRCESCPIGDCRQDDSIFATAFDEYQSITESGISKSQKDAAVKRFRRRANKMIKLLESLLEN